MSKKGENIFKRKDGRWEARYPKGREISGRLKYGYCYGKTYKEAREKAAQAKAAVMSGQTLPKIDRSRFDYYCDEWLRIQKTRVKESTYIKYDNILRLHIFPELGEYNFMGITTSIVEDFKQKLLNEKSLSPKTVKDILIVLHSILAHVAKQNPGMPQTVEIQYPRESKREMRVLSIEEQHRFISYLQEQPDECKSGILLALMTGLRIGELCALRWENIYLENRTIRVCSTMQRLRDSNGEGKSKTRVVVGDPKSETSDRIIPMSESAAGLCAKMLPENPAFYFLTNSERYMEPRALQYRLHKYTEDCGLEGVHFHTLRHTFATRCIEVGFELKSLSEILGHANTSVTLGRYVHSSLALKRDNMNKLSGVGL